MKFIMEEEAEFIFCFFISLPEGFISNLLFETAVISSARAAGFSILEDCLKTVALTSDDAITHSFVICARKYDVLPAIILLQ